MRLVLSKSAVLIHVSLLALFLGSGYCRPSSLKTFLPLILLVISCFEMILLFPVARRGESIAESRRRVARNIVRDPVFYVGLAGLVYLLVQALNGPRALGFDSATMSWGVSPPPLAGLPSSFNQSEALQGFFWFAPAWVALLAIRHALTRRGKTRLLNFLVTLSSALAIFSLVQYARKTSYQLWGVEMPPEGYGTFSYAGFAGAFYSMMFFVAGGLLVTAISSRTSSRRQRLLGIALLLNLVAATFTLRYGAILMVWGGGILGLIYAIAYLRNFITGAKRIRHAAIIMITLGVLAFLHFVAYPENAVHAKTQALFSGEAMQHAWHGQHQVLRRAAWKIFKAHPVYGTGTWGFRHEVGRFLSDQEWSQILEQDGKPLTSYTDMFQFMAELGVIGTGLILTTLLVLLIPLFRRLFLLLCSSATKSEKLHDLRIQRLPPLAVACLFALLGIVIFSFYEMPFRNPLVLLVWCILLAVVPGLLVVPKDLLEAVASSRNTRSLQRSAKRRWNFFGKRRHKRHHADDDV